MERLTYYLPMLSFANLDDHRTWLCTQAALPRGFRCASLALDFTPFETPRRATMRLSLLKLDAPTAAFALQFTRNAFAGAPVLVGRRRLQSPTLGAVLINNKISNVCAPDGVAASEQLCDALALQTGLQSGQILPCSTGIIGWRLPVQAMCEALPRLLGDLRGDSIMPVAQGIMTTDLYPKIRRVALGEGSIVGIAKGAGMVEPNLATMLVYILTDVAVAPAFLRQALTPIVAQSFNAISIDSDESTSDTLALLSSGVVPGVTETAFAQGLQEVCSNLARDVVRNGEGTHHVMQVTVRGAPHEALAKGIGKAVINSPLWQCAVCGNDPNIGRLVMAVGKFLGGAPASLDLARVRMRVGGHEVFANGAFLISPALESALLAHFTGAELYQSVAPTDGVYKAPIAFPPHERCVEVEIDLGAGAAAFTVWGSDRSHEYISENADYRS